MHDLGPTDERALLERIRDGDAQAFDTLVRAHAPTLLRVAQAMTGSRESAKDVVQDVFMRLWTNSATLDVRGDVRGYLWRAIRNQAVQSMRYAAVRDRAGEAISAAHRAAPRVALNAAPGTLDAEALTAQVYEALSGLPRRCREIFLLHWRDELTAEEIAGALGVGLRTVQNQVARAVRRLAEHLAQARL